MKVFIVILMILGLLLFCLGRLCDVFYDTTTQIGLIISIFGCILLGSSGIARAIMQTLGKK